MNAADRVVEVYLVRHGHAGSAARSSGPDDLRPLSAKGLRQATRLGGLLAGAAVHLDVLLSSPKVRAVQTAEILAEALDTRVRLDERLGHGLSLEQLDSIIREAGAAQRIMLVGHDPDLSEISTDLVGAPISVRKGSLVRIDLDPRSVGSGAGALQWLIPPDALG